MRSNMSDNFSRTSSSSPDYIRIENEIEALSSIYFEDLKKISFKFPNYEIKIFLKPNPFSNIQGKSPICWIKLNIKYNSGYPKIPPGIDIYKKYNITEEEIEFINDGVDEIVMSHSAQNCEMIHEVCQFIQKFIDEKSKAFDPNYKKKPARSMNSSPRESAYGKNNLRKYSEGDGQNANPYKVNLEITRPDKEKLSYMKKLMYDAEYSGLKSSSELRFGDLELENRINFGNRLSNTIYSRFITDFEILEKLGQGGGGSVYKVRNNCDSMFYAIKKIKICTDKIKKAKKVLREVMLLSRLQHPQIVRYFQAWIEDLETFSEYDKFNDDEEYAVNEEDEEGESEEDEEDTDDKKQNSNLSNENYTRNDLKMKSRKDNNHNDNIENKTNTENSENEFSQIEKTSKFKLKNQPYTNYNNYNNDNSQSDKKYEDDFCIVFESPKEVKAKNKVWEVEDDTSYYKKIKKEKLNRTKYLFIQMEFCEGDSLKAAIEKRLLQDEKIKWKIILQITDALSYIHTRGLIHRDIKPANIFLDKKFQVKLGDFGLATVTKSKTALENLNPTAKKEFINIKNLNNYGDILSCGIGTMYYCSPEQEINSKYDQKSDMFSLGIVIFEMFYEFGSLMERDIILRSIKDEHKFPQNFIAKAPYNVAQIVKSLTQKEPQLRPSSHELLNSNLLPLNLNEKIVIENFSKIIEENKNYTPKFLDILIKNNLNNNFIGEKEILEKGNNVEPDTSVSHLLGKNIEYNFENLFHKLNFIGHMHIKSFNFVMTIFNKICKKFRKIFKKENAEFLRYSETEKYSNKIVIYDSIKKSLLTLNMNENFAGNKNLANIAQDNVMLTRSGDVVHTTTHMYNQLGKYFIQNFAHVNFCQTKIFCEVLSLDFKTSINKLSETHEIIFNSLWKGADSNILNTTVSHNNWQTKIKIIPDDDEVYEINSLQLLFKIIENFELSNNIHIVVNSTFILDIIFNKINASLVEKINTLKYLQNIFNNYGNIGATMSGSTISNIHTVKDLIKILNCEKNINSKILSGLPIDKDRFRDLLNLLDYTGQIEGVKKKIDKKNELYNELNRITTILQYDFGKEFFNLRHKIKIDFSLVPQNLLCYSGLIYQVYHLDSGNSSSMNEKEKEKIILSEGGRIDNHLNLTSTSIHTPLTNRGFTLRFYTENFFRLKIVKVKEKDYWNFKTDVVIINNVKDQMEIKNEVVNFMNEIQKIASEEKLKTEMIYKEQISTDFMDYFMAYRMKLLVIVMADDKKILVEYKYMDKKKTTNKESFSLNEAMTTMGIWIKKLHKLSM